MARARSACPCPGQGRHRPGAGSDHAAAQPRLSPQRPRDGCSVVWANDRIDPAWDEVRDESREIAGFGRHCHCRWGRPAPGPTAGSPGRGRVPDSGSPWPFASLGVRSRDRPGRDGQGRRAPSPARWIARGFDCANARSSPSTMTAIAAIAIFASALGLLFFAVVEMAFTLLMRLPQRLEAERESEGDALEAYLDDPLTFFVPARLMRGTLIILFVILLSQFVDDGWVGGMILFASGLGAAIGLGQIVPALIVRRSPERLLDLLLPAFTAFANAISPLTVLIIGFLGSIERAAVRESAAGARAALKPGEPDSPPQAEQSLLLRSVVDFGETLVREVMTPRPDIVAIQSEATIDDLRGLVQEQEYSRLPVYTDNLDNIVGLVVVKDLIQRTDTNGGRKVADIMRPASFVPETTRGMDLLREVRQRRVQRGI